MLIAVCLGHTTFPDGRFEMILAGATVMHEDAPEPMVIAASLLSIPGYEVTRIEDGSASEDVITEQVH